VDRPSRRQTATTEINQAVSSNTLPRLYAQAKDLQATLDRAEYLGAKTILPPTEVPGGPKLAMFSDPAGNITGLLMRK